MQKSTGPITAFFFSLSLAIKIVGSFKREASQNQSFLYHLRCRLFLLRVTGFEKCYHIEATSHAKCLLNNEAKMKMYHTSPLETPFPLNILGKVSFYSTHSALLHKQLSVRAQSNAATVHQVACSYKVNCQLPKTQHRSFSKLV